MTNKNFLNKGVIEWMRKYEKLKKKNAEMAYNLL